MNEQTTSTPEAQPTPNNLATLKSAFAKAQALFSTVPNTMWHEREEYSYSSLAASLDTVRPHLAKFGLSLTQRVDCNERGVSCTSRLMHECGDELEGGSIFLPAGSTKPQDLAALMSTARKFSVQALLCIANAGETPHELRSVPGGNKRRSAQRADPGARPTPARQERARQANEKAKNKEPGVWERLVGVGKAEGIATEKLAQLAKHVTGKKTVSSGLTEADFKTVVDAIAEAKKSEAA